MSDAGPRPLGERFRAAREARGASLSDVADQIRIRSVYLSAMEEENWDAIGAPVYIRGFLRTYARYLKLDPEEAVAEFNATLPEPPPPKSVEPERSPASRSRGLLLIWISGTVAVLLVAFVVYNELTLRSERGALATTTATPAPALAASPSPPPLASSPTPGAGGPSSLALVFSAPSWLRVTVDGNVSMEGTFPAGTSRTFHGKNALVRIGNAGGVEIYVDGKDRGKLGKAGDVVEQAFTL
ncbi:MAG: RodZ domain-containing protein [Candidatus Cybelea sp.]